MYGHVKTIINSNMQEIHKANLEICALQEVRRFKQGSTTIECGNSKYEIHWSGQSLKRQHGVGFVVKVDPNVELVQVEYLDARNVVTSQGIRMPTQSDKLLCTN